MKTIMLYLALLMISIFNINAQGKKIVFGQFNFYYNDEKIDFKLAYKVSSVYFTKFTNPQELPLSWYGKPLIRMKPNDDGFFLLKMEPGDYAIKRVIYCPTKHSKLLKSMVFISSYDPVRRNSTGITPLINKKQVITCKVPSDPNTYIGTIDIYLSNNHFSKERIDKCMNDNNKELTVATNLKTIMTNNISMIDTAHYTLINTEDLGNLIYCYYKDNDETINYTVRTVKYRQIVVEKWIVNEDLEHASQFIDSYYKSSNNEFSVSLSEIIPYD
ncbi:hypothetical protein ACFLSE_01775 [Bacteroidota bacterium]